jgi:hypothetical protein
MSQIQVLQWLLRNRDVLTKAIEIAKQFSRHKPYMEQWAVVDQLARLLIPAIFANDTNVAAFAMEEDGPVWGDDYDAKLLSLGAEVGALGLDWKTVIELLLPVLMAILDALAKLKTQ